MTVLVPLDKRSSSSSSSPSFITTSAVPNVHLAKTLSAIMKARRIVVICGAGISVQAGIPDFRSSEGLFQSIKRDNPREQLSSGKELFDASVFNSEHKTSLFCQMIAQLSDLSQAAQPTPFHNLLRALDDRGRLLRVYTQNIDAIEQKSGLSFGVPEFDDKRYKSRSKGKQKEVEDQPLVLDPTNVASCEHAVGPSAVNTTVPSSSAAAVASSSTAAGPSSSANRLPSPPVETPRCIPLHGTLQAMHCQICTRSFPLSNYISALNAGQPPPCPECTSLERARQSVGKRPRGIGRLRPSVVLYNEDHKDGEGVGEVVRKDLLGGSKGKGRGGADLVLVVGTSLRVPGTKRMVREFSKAVKARAGVGAKDETEKTPTKDKTTAANGGLSTPAPSPRRTPSTDEDTLSLPPRAVYLNLDFPVPTREWEGVFDVWIQGDAQQFAELLRSEIDKEAKAKQESTEKKKRKEEEVDDEDVLPDGSTLIERKQKGKMKENMTQDTPSKGKQKDGKVQAKRKTSTNSRVIASLDSDVEVSSLGKRRKTGTDAGPNAASSSTLPTTPVKSQVLPGTPLTPPITPTSRLLSSQKAKARSKLSSTVSSQSVAPISQTKIFLRIPPRSVAPSAVLRNDAELSLPPPLPAAGVCLESSSGDESTDGDTVEVSMDSAPDSDSDVVTASAPSTHALPKGRRDATPPLPQDVWAPTHSPGTSTSALPPTGSRGKRSRRSPEMLQRHEEMEHSRYGNSVLDYDDTAYRTAYSYTPGHHLTGDLSSLTSLSDGGGTSDTLSDTDEGMDVDVVGDDMDVDDLPRGRHTNIHGWYPGRVQHRRNSSPAQMPCSPPRRAGYAREEAYPEIRYHHNRRNDTYPPLHAHTSSYPHSVPLEHSYMSSQYYSYYPQLYPNHHEQYHNRDHALYTTPYYSHATTYEQYAAHHHSVSLSATLPSYTRSGPSSSSHQRNHSQSRREARHRRTHVTAPPLSAHRQLSSGVLISTAPLLSGIRDTAS
ncbi:hypothetical protein CVT24_010323 [Panaeolus cyanescens]|uniref:Deacetylase sirtuin-type domain-containing protein n=1 Tax=Panaeolus cyanescens TaxID=181874 RepID=A0A409VDH8_9AGAR|nr:hypothetical protein CVT24_010323 [Panaeolus cyanescens]